MNIEASGQDMIMVDNYLAGEGAEVEGLLEDPVTGQANVSRALERPGLRPWLQKHHFGTVDGVRLSRTTNI